MTAWLTLAGTASGQDPDNPVSPPPVVPLVPQAPTDLPPSASAPAATPPVIQLPPYEVSAQKEQPLSPVHERYEKLNHVFDGPFPSLRSGPLIEAILWRHRYLTENPGEQAVIVTTQQGERIRSATTIYTKDGKVYGSSNALGEKFPVRGLLPADLATSDGLGKAKKYIAELRGEKGAAVADYATSKDSAGIFGGSSSPAHLPPFGSFLVAAEESGDYHVLMAAAGTGAQFTPSDFAQQNGHGNSQVQRAWNQANNDLGRAFLLPFAEPSGEILAWTYQALHNPSRAGIVPVALARVSVRGPVMTISPFERDNSPARSLQPQDIISNQTAEQRTVDALVFDWDGVQYLYEPDLGTQAKPLPVNAVTGLPYLCVKNGGLLECAYFCATYSRQHPNEKAVLVPGEPTVAAYQKDGKLGMFIPGLGRFTLPKDFWDAVSDNDSLEQLRDQLVALQKQKGAMPDVIPQEIAGDDREMQMRRAFLALEAAGIPCRLREEAEPSLDFSWAGVTYVYGSDQQVRPGSGG